MEIPIVTYKTRPASESVLKAILARNPRASLHEIRRAHPAFQAMSLDHLGLRVGQALDDHHAAWTK